MSVTVRHDDEFSFTPDTLFFRDLALRFPALHLFLPLSSVFYLNFKWGVL